MRRFIVANVEHNKKERYCFPQGTKGEISPQKKEKEGGERKKK